MIFGKPVSAHWIKFEGVLRSCSMRRLGHLRSSDQRTSAVKNHKPEPAARRHETGQQPFLNRGADMAPAAQRDRAERACAQPRRNLQRASTPMARANIGRCMLSGSSRSSSSTDSPSRVLRRRAGDRTGAFVAQDRQQALHGRADWTRPRNRGTARL